MSVRSFLVPVLVLSHLPSHLTLVYTSSWPRQCLILLPSSPPPSVKGYSTFRDRHLRPRGPQNDFWRRTDEGIIVSGAKLDSTITSVISKSLVHPNPFQSLGLIVAARATCIACWRHTTSGHLHRSCRRSTTMKLGTNQTCMRSNAKRARRRLSQK